MDTPSSVILVGHESVGKTSLFRRITGDRAVREANFRGSTVFCRTGRVPGQPVVLTDSPGIRFDVDSVTAQLALDACRQGDVVGLVVRLPHLASELSSLTSLLEVRGKRVFVVVTHRDLDPGQASLAVESMRSRLAIPAVSLDAREVGAEERSRFLEAASQAAQLDPGLLEGWQHLEASERPRTGKPASRRGLLPPLAAASVGAIFGLPVFLSYQFASRFQPLFDAWMIRPLSHALSGLPPGLRDLLMGPYGAISLGGYSFLWAFPTVLLVGLSLALTEETGLAERITQELDPAMRRIGMSGRDLIPVLTGFGCNVVAVFQSRSCSRCDRAACVSMIAFASACSYQLGASLSVFGSAGHPGLFFPYLFALFVVGAAHTRLWGKPGSPARIPLPPPALQRPTWNGVKFRLRAAVAQFLTQAMPIFLAICVASTLLKRAGALEALARLARGPFRWLGLPAEAAPGVIFSVLRKDGLLVLNQNGGALLSSMPAGRLFLLVFLASSLSPCLVTLLTVAREMGFAQAARIAARQALTSLAATVGFAVLLDLAGVA